MLLAAGNLIDHITDHPWPGCQVELFGMKVTLMSSGIASMILVAIVLCAVIIPLARRRQRIPTGGKNVLEVIVIFVRDMIARPALHERAYEFLPMLLTLFVFVLGMNLVGILPLEGISHAVGLGRTPIGATPTGILTVCGGLASLTLMTIVSSGLKNEARLCRERHNWPGPLCAALSPFLWVRSLSPSIGGVTGAIMCVPMAILELVGTVAKCTALMIRLFANMMAGHALLAVLMMFVLDSLAAWLRGQVHLLYIGPVCILASVVVDVMELLVAALQAYIFTFLTAMFIGMYTEGAHR